MSDIRDHLPDYYDGVLEMAEIINSDDIELDKIKSLYERTFLNLYVLKADSDGLRALEEAYNIAYDPNLSLDQRRYNLIMKLLPPRPITIKYFKELLNSVGITAKLDINAIADTINAELDTATFKTEQIAQLDDMMKTYLPANLAQKIYVYTYTSTTAFNFIGTANQLSVSTASYCKDEL